MMVLINDDWRIIVVMKPIDDIIIQCEMTMMTRQVMMMMKWKAACKRNNVVIMTATMKW